jgi:hypothetical protein
MPIPLRELSVAMNQNDLTFARSFCIATLVEVILDPVPDQRPSFANSIRRSMKAVSTPSDAEAGSGSGNERNDAKSYEGSTRDQSKTISPDEAENPPQHDHAAPTVTRSKSNKMIDGVALLVQKVATAIARPFTKHLRDHSLWPR